MSRDQSHVHAFGCKPCWCGAKPPKTATHPRAVRIPSDKRHPVEVAKEQAAAHHRKHMKSTVVFEDDAVPPGAYLLDKNGDAVIRILTPKFENDGSPVHVTHNVKNDTIGLIRVGAWRAHGLTPQPISWVIRFLDKDTLRKLELYLKRIGVSEYRAKKIAEASARAQTTMENVRSATVTPTDRLKPGTKIFLLPERVQIGQIVQVGSGHYLVFSLADKEIVEVTTDLSEWPAMGISPGSVAKIPAARMKALANFLRKR